ncbi:MAG TPA: TetR family transcriptional regulator, partial [Wenzhouxiangella sp.]|nr:TetR family transcriptional regulator [Wenzhouxiangella sp.]
MPISTRDRILDAAERLFAEQGFHLTTLRQITQAAGANLAAVNYYFGSKQELIRAIFRRRLDALNAARLARLDAIERERDRPDLEAVLDAFVQPALEFTQGGDAEGQRFMQLLLRAFADRDTALHDAMRQEYAHVMRRFADAVSAALPHADHARLRHQLDFIVGALTLTMAESALKDTRIIAAELAHFAAAGLRGSLESPTPESARGTLETTS